MTEPAFRKLTEEAYLELLEESETRYEFIDGFIYAQAGARNAHNIITGNIFAALHGPARNSGCRLYQSDMRLRVGNSITGQIAHYFPDLMLSCEKATQDPKTLHLTAPCLIVEVLSQSTFREDKNSKWTNYQSIGSLQAYLMVDSLSRSAAIWRRSETGWEYKEVEDSVALPCVNVTLSLEEVYEGVNL